MLRNVFIFSLFVSMLRISENPLRKLWGIHPNERSHEFEKE
jgi:hypothetical protein